MAFRRSLASRAKILYQQQQRLSVPFSHIGRDVDGDRENLSSRNPVGILSRRLFEGGVNVGSFCGSSPRNMFHDRRFAAPAALALFSARKMSTFGEGTGAEKLEIMTDVLGETAVEAASQVGNEVAVAAADSFLPVAALQHMIDYVHTFTGLEWWASIVVTTVLIRTLLLPFPINQVIARSKVDPKFLSRDMVEITNYLWSRDADADEALARIKKLFDKYGVTFFSLCTGEVIGFSVFFCFFFALSNMAEKLQSFKDGGALWFTDLTTPDATYILPVMTALAFWMKTEVDPVKGKPAANTYGFKITSIVFPVLIIPVAAYFPKAILCYAITHHLYSLAFGLVMMQPEVKKMLGIARKPPPPPPPPSTSTKPRC